MATDYDTPRKTDEELHEESLEELKARRAEAQSGQVDLDEEEAENVELPGADLSGEELAVRVVPKQENELKAKAPKLFAKIVFNPQSLSLISLDSWCLPTNMGLDLSDHSGLF
ncbi:MAG: hypothetical protein RL029_373 [Actinomycetota bacterium]